MTESAIRYAVSSGNGNDGVSQLYPRYIVTTNEPWLLARLAAVTEFKAGHGRRWCRNNLDLDGESAYTIYAVLHDPPAREGRGYGEHNGAWSIWEVFPAEGEYSGKPEYDSLDDCFGRRTVAIERRLYK